MINYHDLQVTIRCLGGLNMVRGFFIFIIFICKQSVWDLAKKEYPRLTGFFSKRKTKTKTKTKTKRKRKASKKSNLRKYEVCQLEIIAKEEKQIFALERLI